MDVINALADAGARKFAKGLVQGFARKWTIEDLRGHAARGSDLAALERTQPNLLKSMRRAFRRFPSIQTLRLEDIFDWIREANPSLARQMRDDPEVWRWLRNVWHASRQELR